MISKVICFAACLLPQISIVCLFLHHCQTKSCEQVPSKWWEGGITGAVQCYSYRSLRQHSPTHWIIIWLCQYCSCVGKEWHRHTLLEREGEPLAVLKVSHILYVQSTDQQHITEPTVTLKPYKCFKRLKDMPFFSHLQRPKLIEIDSGREATQRMKCILWRQRIKRSGWIKPQLIYFSMKTLICEALLEVWRGKTKTWWICNRKVFQLFALGRAPLFNLNPPALRQILWKNHGGSKTQGRWGQVSIGDIPNKDLCSIKLQKKEPPPPLLKTG